MLLQVPLSIYQALSPPVWNYDEEAPFARLSSEETLLRSGELMLEIPVLLIDSSPALVGGTLRAF